MARGNSTKGARKAASKAATEADLRREILRRIRASNSSRTFGLRLREVRRGSVSMEMKAAPRFLQVEGRVHGGVIALLADTAGSLAAYSALPARTRVVTLEMKINFLAGIKGGTMAAHGKMLRVGKNTGVSECEVRDAGGRLAAKALLTVAIAPPPDSSTRNGTTARNSGN